MKNTTNLLILNLAVADLLFILVCLHLHQSLAHVSRQVCVPATASDYIMHWPFGLTWCRTVQYIIYVTAYVSIYTLVLMAGDRSVVTVKGRKWFKLLIVIWIYTTSPFSQTRFWMKSNSLYLQYVQYRD